jgi:rhodanese-related sulfurtransferase
MKRRLWALFAVAAVAATTFAVVASRATTGGSSTSAQVPGHASLLDSNGVASEDLAAAQGDIAAGALILDVRKDDEWAAGRVAGSMHIPLAEVQDRAGELPKGRVIVTVCKDGGRSYKAAYALRQVGFDAVNLDGGLTGWEAAGLPLINDAGSAGHIG